MGSKENAQTVLLRELAQRATEFADVTNLGELISFDKPLEYALSKGHGVVEATLSGVVVESRGTKSEPQFNYTSERRQFEVKIKVKQVKPTYYAFDNCEVQRDRRERTFIITLSDPDYDTPGVMGDLLKEIEDAAGLFPKVDYTEIAGSVIYVQFSKALSHKAFKFLANVAAEGEILEQNPIKNDEDAEESGE